MVRRRIPEALADGGYRLSKEAIILYGMTHASLIWAPAASGSTAPAPGVTETPILDQLRSAYGQDYLDDIPDPARPGVQSRRAGRGAGVPEQPRAPATSPGQVIWVDGGSIARHAIAATLERIRIVASMNDFRRVADDVRNWGRWGDDDELGTLNFITADKVAEAAASGQAGQGLSARRSTSAPSGPQGAFQFRQNPIHVMTVDGGDAETLVKYGPNGCGTRRAGTQCILRRQPVPVQRRHDHHAAAGGHPVGRAVARLLRGQAVQRFPGGLGDQSRRLPLRHRQGGRQGHHLTRGAARRRAASGRRRLLRARQPDHAGRTGRDRRQDAGRRDPRAATSSSSTPAGGRGSCRPATATRPAPVWTGRARPGCTTTRSPRWPPTT